MVGQDALIAIAEAHKALSPPVATAALHIINTPSTEWEARWRSIRSARLAGPVRSFMWRLMHRRLLLLSSSWYANHLGLTQDCLLCGDSTPETLSHLFSDCAMARELWTSLQPMLTLLHADMGRDHRPARLVGDLSIFSLTWLQAHRWPPGITSPPPTPLLRQLVRQTWTAVRSVVLHAIWKARCDLLHGNLVTRDAAQRQAHTQVHAALRTLTYLHAPNLLCSIAKPPSTIQQEFTRLTWGKWADVLLLARHRIPSPLPH